MKDKNIIYSLHRPFHKSLVSVKWVCIYMEEMEKKQKKISPSSFYIDFFFYFINILNTKYNKLNIPAELEGVPTPNTLKEVISHFMGYSDEEKSELLKVILANRESDIEKKIYSTYKATSYYINLAKDKFELINEKYILSEYGRELASSKYSFFALSPKEQKIIFERILFADFYMIIPLCLSLRSIVKHKWNFPNIHLAFIEEAYHINHFKYTQTSITKNYDNVRLYWLEYLDVLNKNMNIKKRYLNIILENNEYKCEYNNILQKFIIFEKKFLFIKNKKFVLFSKLKMSYTNNINKGLHDQSFVNLYDIKRDFRMSFSNFEKILNDYYESERKNQLILFSNTVTNIDKRKRFYIRNKPVIKIKIY